MRQSDGKWITEGKKRKKEKKLKKKKVGISAVCGCRRNLLYWFCWDVTSKGSPKGGSFWRRKGTKELQELCRTPACPLLGSLMLTPRQTQLPPLHSFQFPSPPPCREGRTDAFACRRDGQPAVSMVGTACQGQIPWGTSGGPESLSRDSICSHWEQWGLWGIQGTSTNISTKCAGVKIYWL